MLMIISWQYGCAPDEILNKNIDERPESHIHQDNALQWARGRIELAKFVPVKVFTIDHVFFTALRVALREAWCKNEVIWHSNAGIEHMEIDTDGRMEYWPDGFMDVYDNLLDRLL